MGDAPCKQVISHSTEVTDDVSPSVASYFASEAEDIEVTPVRMSDKVPTEVSLTISPGRPLEGDVDDLPVLVSVHMPDCEERMPCDICCVIDISWSMSMEATVQASNGKAESNGLSMLDVAKHAVRTIMHSLTDKDRLAIVQFAKVASTVLPLTAMNEDGRSKADSVLDQIGFGPGTAMWQGLSCALDALLEADANDSFQHVMLLTDGETEDRDVIMDNLKEHKRKHEHLPGTINCFGFGYEIDSPLLVDIASFSDGSYAFIPDAGFVGTVFVNSMSNLLVTAAKDTQLTLQAKAGAEIKEVMAWDWKTMSDGSLSVDLGSFQCGQPKDIVLMMSAKAGSEPYVAASVEYSTLHGRHKVSREARSEDHTQAAAEAAERQRCRGLLVAALAEAAAAAGPGTEEAVKAGHQLVMNIATQVAASPMASDERVAALLEDILGQSSEALSRVDYWNKWGRHYMPSVMLAHKLQLCNNFKDPGVQFYGGELFNELRDVADSAFDKLPVPKITPAMYRYMGDGKVIRNSACTSVARPDRPAYVPAPVVNMAAYNDRYGGCIDGASRALLASGKLSNVSSLSKGDSVAVGDGSAAEIVCVVRTRCVGQRATLVELPGGARLTRYHPVQINGDWRFPEEIGAAKEYFCEAVYSFVLRGAPSLLVGGVPCVALGHGLQEGAAKHPYFGSSRVLEDVAALPGFQDGLIDLSPGCAVRDPETGLVCGLRSELRP